MTNLVDVISNLGDFMNDAVLIAEAEPVTVPGPRILWCNRSFEAMTGYAAHEIIGQTPRILQGPETCPETRARITAALRAWRPVREEVLNYRKDGAPFWVELDIRPVADEHGWYRYWVAIQRDVTDRRAAEAALAAARAEAAVFFDIALAVKCITDTSGRLVRVNAAFLSLLGLTEYQVIGEQPIRWVHPEDIEPTRAAFVGVLDGSDVAEFVNRYRANDGSWRHITWRAQRVGARVYACGRDITQQLADQHELHRQTLAAQAADAAKSAFLATMSHELRTPLNGVLGMLELALRGELAPPARERLEIAYKSSNELLHTLNEILDFSKIEAGELEILQAPMQVRTVIDDVMRLFAPRAGERGLAFTSHVEPGVPVWIVGDARRVRQIIGNYVANAIKFTAAGRIEVTCRVVDEAIEIAVADTGIGLSAEAQMRLFTRFWQADASLARKYEGAGLGLAIAKDLAALLGGSVGCDSREGEGARFWVRFPRLEPGDAHATAEADPDDDLAVIEPAAGLRVLVAEDHKVNQLVIGQVLAAGGHRYDIFENGAEAAEAAARGGYDVVLMDIQMPVMDGLEATRVIRALPGALGRVPIIAVTANAIAGDRERYLAAGMDDYIAKPISAAQVLTAVAHWSSDGGQD